MKWTIALRDDPSRNYINKHAVLWQKDWLRTEEAVRQSFQLLYEPLGAREYCSGKVTNCQQLKSLREECIKIKRIHPSNPSIKAINIGSSLKEP